MARATSIKKRTFTTDGDKSSVTMISPRNTLEDQIRLRAYLLYEQEGRQEGRDNEYWLRAESEVLERYGPQKG